MDWSRPNRAVGLELGVQGVHIVDAELLRDAFLQYRETVTADREKIVHRHAVARRGIDALSVEGHAIGYDAVAIGLGVVPKPAEPAAASDRAIAARACS